MGGSACRRAFASLYRELGKIGVSASAVRHDLVWQVAAMLGVGWDSQDPRSAGAPSSASKDLLRQRIAASQGLVPEPEARPPTPEEMEMMQEAFGAGIPG